MKNPLIYVCALPRTGSTVIAEALTLIPHCFMHTESLILEGHLYWENLRMLPESWPLKTTILARVDETIDAYIAEYNLRKRVEDVDVIGLYIAHFVVPLLDQVDFVGIKEITNSRWRQLLAAAPDTKVVLTCRHPVGIVNSLLHMRKNYAGVEWEWNGLTLEQIVARLMAEFVHQKGVSAAAACLKVKYEDLRRDPAVFERIATFAFGRPREVGAVGCYNAGNTLKKWEADLYKGQLGGAVSPTTHQSLLTEDEIAYVTAAMGEYIDFFGYENSV